MMKEFSDEELLREYVARGSDPAFEELVRRYGDMVHSIAARLVDWDTAKDVSQRVFLTLAKKAGQLESPVYDWLRCTAFHIASGIALGARRRQNREQEAVSMNERLASGEACNWDAIRPHLEYAMHQLDDDDRRIVMLRYYLRLSSQQAAEKLGISDEVARQRASRALQRLRDYFARHGITASTSALAVVISSNAVQAAPAGLAASIIAAVTAAKVATAATAVSAAAATRVLTMTTLKNAMLGTTLVGLLGFGIYEASQAEERRAATDRWAQQQALLTGQLDGKDQQLADLQRQLTAEQALRRQFQARAIEVLRLRGEVAALRARLTAATPGTKQSAAQQAWLDRAAKLEQRAAETRGMNIPELGLVSEDDWLDASKDLTETEDGYLEAFSAVRALVEGRFAGHVHEALKKNMAASAGRFPTQIDQLAAYFDPPLDPAMLVRWQVVPVKDDDVETTESGLIIRLRSVDPKRDVQWAVDANGPRSIRISPLLLQPLRNEER